MLANGSAAAASTARDEIFSGIDSWVFDLDETLYPAASGLQVRIRERIIVFIADLFNIGIAEAAARRVGWYERYGSALYGLIHEHGVDPVRFLEFVHDVDLGVLNRDEGLIQSIAALPGRRLIFTNGSKRHAEAVLEALGLRPLFEEVCHIEDRSFVSKPQEAAYDCLLKRHGIVPANAAIFDDTSANLVLPKAHGMRTVLVVPAELGAAAAAAKPPHIDAVTGNLAAFLRPYAEE